MDKSPQQVGHKKVIKDSLSEMAHTLVYGVCLSLNKFTSYVLKKIVIKGYMQYDPIYMKYKPV